MKKRFSNKIRVTIMSGDPFVRMSIHKLLATDWRTQVLNICSDPGSLSKTQSTIKQADFLVLDINPEDQSLYTTYLKRHGDKNWFFKNTVIITNQAQTFDKSLFTSHQVRGILIKNEIMFGLAWALDFAHRGYWVMSPGIENELVYRNIPLPHNHMVLRSDPSLYCFSPRQLEAIWLGIILGLDRRIIAREMDITEGTSYGLISAVYRRLGVDELLNGEAELEDYIPEQGTIKNALASAQSQVLASGSTHIRDKSELVFHLLTCPDLFRFSKGD